VGRVLKEADGRVRFVWRHLPQIGEHIDSLPAAEASQEIYSQKGSAGFWAFHEQLLKNQNALLRKDLERYAATLSVDRQKFTLAMDRHRHEAFVREDMAAARALGYEDPPVITVNDYVLHGPVDPGQLERTFQRALRETQR
jgi:protein-disulfide isomerase